MIGTAIVLIPPLVIIMLVLMTRRVIPSLGVGIILSMRIFISDPNRNTPLFIYLMRKEN